MEWTWPDVSQQSTSLKHKRFRVSLGIQPDDMSYTESKTMEIASKRIKAVLLAKLADVKNAPAVHKSLIRCMYTLGRYQVRSDLD